VKVAFVPVSILGGLLAGLVAKFAFERVWGLIDDEEPPDPEHREISAAKLVLALLIEGAIFRAARGLFDHAARLGFARWTGEWPGDERPDPA
jgi:Protein of unknown function (DUF4235)